LKGSARILWRKAWESVVCINIQPANKPHGVPRIEMVSLLPSLPHAQTLDGFLDVLTPERVAQDRANDD
jgi:hypothetical protein